MTDSADTDDIDTKNYLSMPRFLNHASYIAYLVSFTFKQLLKCVKKRTI